MTKGEIANNEKFLFLSQCFQKSCAVEVSTSGKGWDVLGDSTDQVGKDCVWEDLTDQVYNDLQECVLFLCSFFFAFIFVLMQ